MIFKVKTIGKDIRVSLFWRGDAIYYRFWWRGKEYRESTKKSTEREAREVARKEADKVSGGFTPSDYALSKAIEDYKASRWPEDKRKGNRSYQDAKSRLAKFLAFAKDIDLGALADKEVTDLAQRFFDHRAKKQTGRTVVNDKQILSQFFKWFIRSTGNGWLVNPALCLTITLPPTEDKEPEPLDQSAIEALLPPAQKSNVWPIILLCLGCGLRPAEATRLEWSDVDFDRSIVKVINKKGKRRRPRHPDMNSWVSQELKAIKETSKTDSLFPFNHFTAFDMMADLCKLTAVSASLQRLRQTACTRAIEGGMELSDYVLQFGHSLAVAEKHYLKYGKKDRRMKALEALNFSNTGPKTSPPIS